MDEMNYVTREEISGEAVEASHTMDENRFLLPSQ